MILKFLLLTVGLSLQDTTEAVLRFKPEWSMEISADFFTTDRSGNIYVVRKDQIAKYASNGDSLYTQSFKNSGPIRFIDASNGLRVVLFYPELTRVAVLDNTLSLQGDVVRLEAFDLQFSTLLCQSLYYNQLWIYTTDNFRLLRVDYQFGTIRESGNLTQVIGTSINPNYISEGDQRVYLNDPENGIHVFDLFATFIQTIPVKDLDYFQVSGDYLYYLKEDTLHAYHLRFHQDFSITLPVSNVRHFRIEKKKIYFLHGNKLSVYSLD